MPLVAGQALSFYEILGPLGVGGMGEVYRARDTRLEREVAIKVLPEELADDEERLRRFEREAKTLASLHHPNIASIFGIDQVDDVCLIAMELVPGEDLAERLARGPLPVDEAIDACRQIAEGLEVAHEAGVVHRDLKPANVRVTPDGVVKLLDFGLAKPIQPQARHGNTTTAEPDSFLLSAEGLVLGTPTYMSPEQARGKPVDRRTDIWAFGCVLFECLTGERAFGGESLTDVLAAIVQREPRWEALPRSTPPHVRALLVRTLEKDPRKRLRDIGEARVALEGPGRREEPAAQAPAGGKLGWLVAAAAGAIALGLAARELVRDDAPPRAARTEVVSFTLDQPLVSSGTWGGNLVAISNDGRTIAHVGVEGDTRVFLRALDAFEARPVPGSDRARSPFLSPDGSWVGFWSEGALRKAPVDGGPAIHVADLDTINAATWGPDDRIVVAETVGGLLLVDARSGAVERLTEVGDSIVHDAPSFLPGGELLIFDHEELLAVARLDGSWTSLDIPGFDPRWSPTGHVLFQRNDYRLWAVPFDAAAGAVTGEPFLARTEPLADFDVSEDGTFVYVPGTPLPEGELVWVDRSGQATPLDLGVHRYLVPRLSPRGDRIAVSAMESGGGRTDLWVLDVGRGSRTRFTTQGPWNVWPVWTHDGSRICYMAEGSIFWKPADGSGAPQPLLERENFDVPLSWSEAGQALSFYDYGRMSDLKVWHADGEVEEFLATEFDERAALFSPDGEWIVYVSNQSGIDEVFVRPYARGAGPGARLPISSGGGTEARWSPDGREITYRRGTQMFAVPFDPGPPARAGAPELLFDGPLRRSPVGRGNPNYDVAADGRFLMIRGVGAPVDARVHVVRGWSVR